MLETILLQIVAPILLTVSGSWAGFKWGRKKTKGELTKENIENTTLIVDLVNKQLNIVYDRVYKLEKEVTKLEASIIDRDDIIQDKRTMIKEAFKCPYASIDKCPVLLKRQEINNLNKRIKNNSLNLNNNETTVETDGSDA